MRFDANKFRLLSVVAVTAAAAAALLGVDLATGATEPSSGAATPTTTQVTQGPIARQPSKVDVAVDMQSLREQRNKIARKSGRSLSCRNDLARTLYGAGFRGEDLREAWAIAMRESNGLNLGPGDSQFNGEDWGIVQFNKPTWGDEPWWDDEKILNPDYSARIMYRMSKGGTNWQMWGLTADGQLDTSMYRGWSSRQHWAWIIEPYQRWYRQYPC